jgi:hypothetical protein
MKHTMDLSGELFDTLYFNESVTAFRMPETFGPSLSLLVWGAYLAHPDEQLWEQLPSEIRQQARSPLYLSGWGVLSFDGVKDGSASVAIYEAVLPPTDSGLLRKDGMPVTLIKPWHSTPDPDQFIYCLESYLEVPFSHLTLEIVATGAVHFNFNPHEFVTSEMLSQFPNRYAFDRFRERQLATLRLE